MPAAAYDKLLACCRDSDSNVLLRSWLVSCIALAPRCMAPSQSEVDAVSCRSAILLVISCLHAGHISYT